MTTGRNLLLRDARNALGQAISAASGLDLADKAFAAWLLGWNDCPFDIPGLIATSIANRAQGYREVAAMGYLAGLTSPACSFRSELCEGLIWLSSRPTTMCGTVAGFVSDPAALLGIALGASYAGDSSVEAAVVAWLEQICVVRIGRSEFEPWEKCVMAAAAHRLRRPDLAAVSDLEDVADCRVALRAHGALPEVYPAEAHADEARFIARLVGDDATEAGYSRTVLRAAAYDAIKLGIVVHLGGVATGMGSTDMAMSQIDESRKTVFVSYSWESSDPEHQPRVLRFTQDLRRYGFAATMDLFEPNPPEGLPQWMVNQIRHSDFVVMVITETYRRRFEGDEEKGKGKGVKWEGGIVTRAIYDSEFQNRKFIPVVFGQKHVASMPTILVGDTYYDVTNPERLEDLVRYMTNQPAYIPAPIGRVPKLLPRDTSEKS